MNKKIRNILLGLAAAVVLVSSTIQAIPHFVLEASEDLIEPEANAAIEVKGSIAIQQGEVLVAESATKELYLDTSTLDIRIVDKENGKEWGSKLEAPSNDKDLSVVNISYLSNDNRIQEWNSKTAVIEHSSYTINEIENGVRMVMNFQTETKTPEQMVPSYISEEDLQSYFHDAIAEGISNGIIEENQLRNYENLLNTIYKKDLAKGGYKLVSAGLPPSALGLLNTLTQQIDFTEDMVRERNEAAGLDIEIPESPEFTVIVDAYLDGEDLVINVPTYESSSGNDSYELLTLEAYSNFGYASSDHTADGYIFVPDGAGALFEINTYDSSFPQYSRPIYENSIYDEMYTMGQYNEMLHMPVFGLTHGKDENSTHGFMGIIESGEELASINVRLGTDNIATGGNVNNRVYTTLDMMQYSRINLMGAYSDNESRYLVSTGPIDVDYTVRYKLFNDTVTYYDMAKSYQDYLVDKYALETNYSNEAKVYLEVLGALTIPTRIAGIPYDKTISMTTYEQLQAIVEDLGDKNLIVNYQGAFFGGDHTSIPTSPDLVKENGTKDQLQALQSVMDSRDNELLLGTNLTIIEDQGYPFDPEVHAMYHYDSKPLQMYDYHYVTEEFSSNFNPRTIMHPKYFGDIVSRFLEGTEAYENVYIEDVGNTYYANYKEDDILTPIQANVMIEEGLESLSENKVLALNNPNMNTLPYADYAINISRESSDYGTMYQNVPFRQIVLNGLVEYTTLDVNMSKENSAYYLLQALELGSYPKFTISHTHQDVLKDSKHREYSSVEYATLKPRIEALYTQYTDAFAQIGTTEIVNHSMLQENVFKTEYANGVEVIVNYNKDDITVEGKKIEAEGFYIN